jgi:hypothetical protein
MVMRKLKKELWPHMITLNKVETDGDFYGIEVWLGENIGCFKQLWNAVYHHNKTDIYFKHSKDATYFALRWS